MTGTSLDALDCALVRVSGVGLALRAEVVRCTSVDLGELHSSLRRLAEGTPATAGEIAGISLAFSELHARAVAEIAKENKLDLVCVHGQTIFHKPPVSWQLLNPWPIVRAVNAPVVFDLRGADLAAGGQGAPITPIADAVLLSHHPELSLGFAVVNLGGFANATVVPSTSQPISDAWLNGVKGFDICVCNQLLDRIARNVLSVPFDDGGRIALSGTVNPEAASDLAHVLQSQSSAGRSLGSGDEAGDWVASARTKLKPADLAATAVDAIAKTVWMRCRGVPNVLLAGGGSKNAAIFRAIAQAAGCTAAVSTIDRFGVPAEYREAIEFAVLGALCQDGVAITLPSVTGVRGKAPLSGAWAYPGK